MSKLFRISGMALLLLLPSVGLAAPTRFESSNYGVESVIFGGTGLLKSLNGSVPPTITTQPEAIDITTTSASIQWKTDLPTNSILFLGTSPGVYTSQSGQIAEATLTDHEVLAGQLKRGTQYFYKVRSGDVTGNIVESPEKTFTTDQGDITAPVITKGPIISTNSGTSVIVTWETNELANTTVEYGLNTVSDVSAGRSDELTLFHQVELSSLLPDRTYKFRIKSRDASDNLYTGDTQEFVTPRSTTITDVKVTDITLDSALVQWKTTTSSTSVVDYGTGSTYGLTNTDGSFAQNHVAKLTGLQSGSTYYLRISGDDQAGNRLTSDEYVFKTVVLPVISDFTITQVSSNIATLTWTSSSDIDELVRYEITGSGNKELIGKKLSAGNDQAVSKHTYQLSDLESGSQYSVLVSGKDVFGNQALSPTLTFSTKLDGDPPQILNVKTDTSVDLGSRQSVQVLVSFGLSELGTSIIEYGAGATGAYDSKVTTDTETSQNKFMVIPGLRPGESYHFHIVAKDRVGNTTTSADYLVLAPSQPVSLLDLIFGQVQQNFGWLGHFGGK